jgi:hypothetical protein
VGASGSSDGRGRSPIRLARSVTLPTYQLRATIPSSALAPDRQMEAAVRIAMRWVAEKLPVEVVGLEEMANPFRLEVDAGTFVETVWLASERVWAMRLVHPDTGDVRAPVAGRTFTTHATFLERGGAVEVAVQTLCTQPPTAPRDVDVVRPALVGRLVKELGLKDVLSFDGQPVVVAKEADLAELRALLKNPHRALPVVVVRRAPAAVVETEASARGSEAPGETSATGSADAPAAPVPAPTLDVGFLAEKLLGYATVVVLEGEAAAAYPQKIPADFLVDVGGVRIYQPGLTDWKTEPAQRHPRFTEESVRYWSVSDPDGGFRTGPAAFSDYVVRSVRAGMAQRTVDWRGIRLFPAVLDAYLEEHQERVGEEDCRTCKDNYEKRISTLRREVEDLKQQNEYFASEHDAAKDEAQVLKQDKYLLEERVRALTDELDGRDVPAEAGERLPVKIFDVPDWARARLGRRLLLLPRAVRELKSADFEDVPLLCEALKLLAQGYYEMQIGNLRVAEFTDRVRALGLTWGQSTDEAQAGRYGESYYVQYPPQQGRGRRTFLQQHLRKGTSFESRHCLRIYFFWGEEDQKVVVGSLPKHLPSGAD